MHSRGATFVVEVDVRAEHVQNRTLVDSAQKEGLIDPDPQARRVLTTRLCAGAFRAVTSAVRIGDSSSGNLP